MEILIQNKEHDFSITCRRPNPLISDILKTGDDTDILLLRRDLEIETVIRLLVDNGADINIFDIESKSSFYYLHRIISTELKMKFINCGADVTVNYESGVSIIESILIHETTHY